MIAELYPEAWTRLGAARRAKVELASTWRALLADGLADFSVTNNPDGRGYIVAYADWPQDARAHLTAILRTCLGELWACLDSLITESVAMFSILRQPRNPNASRYFPIADSAENFEALMAESCVDDILQLQFDMIRDCQPFEHQPQDERIERFRRGLRQLLDWSNRLETGSQVGAWATPVAPQVHVDAPAKLIHLESQPPGELHEERLVARFALSDYTSRTSVAGQAGTYVDLAFPDGFHPRDPDDTFDRRLEFVIDIVTRFAASFAWLASRAPGAKHIILGNRNPAETWIEASRSSRRWTERELDSLAESDLGLGVVQDTSQLTLIVQTADGVYERMIPDASLLRSHPIRGTAAEHATQDAAATWGLPDFVMRPYVERKGPGIREISDGLLVVGDRGVIIQVKCRDVEPRTPDRERNWIDKQVRAARSQTNGTVRRLRTRTVEMVNGRGREVTIEGSTIDWVGVVIIEHPNPPNEHPLTKVEGAIPSIVLLRRDWEFLFNQLRSSRAVVDYLHRVGASAERLGAEPQRYYELAAADAATIAEPTDPTIQWRGGDERTVPLLPTAPAGSDDDEAHGMFRIMCEDIATSPIPGHREEDRIKILASIDRLPVAYRSELGRLLLSGLHAAHQANPSTTTWRFRTFRPTQPGETQLGFGVCSTLTDTTREAFRSWFLLRHHERGESEPLAAATSIGILLTPRSDGYRDWDTTMMAIAGDPELTAEELDRWGQLWNTNANVS